MKTVLFATTALVATAGIAAAEISLSGFAEMGVIGGDAFDTMQFHTDIDVTFTMSGETDGGLSFGANIDLDELDTDRSISGRVVNNPDDPNGDASVDIEVGGSPAFDNETQGGELIFVSGDFGTLTMGDTDGALDWALSEAIIGASINDDNEHGGYNGNAGLDGTYDGQIARYDYSFDAFSVAVSGEIDDGDAGDPVLGLGVRYATQFGGTSMAFGAGVQTISGIRDLADDIAGDIFDDENNLADNATIWGVSADLGFQGGVQAIVNYTDLDGINGYDHHWGLAVGYTMDALTVAANYGKFDGDINEADGYALIANYDLGGGAELQAGYGNSDNNGTDSDQFSFGIAMSF